ncbi:MAG: D-alanyl-D-alanine dipeptidase, partial [Endozoicomonas sp.]
MSRQHQLVKITTETFDVDIHMAYAGTDNFTDKAIYSQPLCLLHEEAASKLEKAIEILHPLGLRLLIWDAFRPLEAQRALYDCVPDPEYVSHPETGVRPHCRGIAIDLTIIDSFGQPLAMGTDFDDFRALAHHGNDQVSEKAQRNRLLLAGAMNIAGFDPIQSEWWHYQLPNAEQYPIL